MFGGGGGRQGATQCVQGHRVCNDTSKNEKDSEYCSPSNEKTHRKKTRSLVAIATVNTRETVELTVKIPVTRITIKVL